MKEENNVINQYAGLYEKWRAVVGSQAETLPVTEGTK